MVSVVWGVWGEGGVVEGVVEGGEEGVRGYGGIMAWVGDGDGDGEWWWWWW